MLRVLALSLLFISQALAAGPKIAIVIGSKATTMDKLAAEQLRTDFGLLFDAESTIEATVPKDAANVVLVGSPYSNAAIPKEPIEKLSVQGHLLKSTDRGLIVGGGSPTATFWAAGELSYRFGIRHLLHGDVLPVEKPAFTLQGFDVVLEPKVRERGWSMYNGSATGAESWGTEEHLKLIKQLAKLKFTHLLVPKNPTRLAPLAVDGDTAGRKVFAGARLFPNADTTKELNADAKALGLLVEPIGLVTHSLGAHSPSVLPLVLPESLNLRMQNLLKFHGTRLTVGAITPGDLNTATHFVSRICFDDKMTFDQALNDLVTPICGEGVVERFQKGLYLIGDAAKLIEANDASFGIPGANMMRRYLDAKESLPTWITEAKTHYTNAMNEMYRANTRAREGARPFILYHAKRLEFALHYCTAIESLYKAHDKAVRAESIEAAVEAMYNALNAYADVARDPSDHGAIALLNEHGYRALTKIAAE